MNPSPVILSAARKVTAGAQATPRAGFALVLVLVILAALTALAVLTLTLARFEARAAALHADKIRADWAAQAALREAMARLTEAITAADGQADRVFVTAQLEPPADCRLSPILIISGSDGKMHPLISSPTQTGAADDAALVAALFAERDGGADLNRHGFIDSGSDAADFTVKLLELTDGDEPVARYGYQILDEEARLDPRLHRAADREQYGQSAAEIPLCVDGTAGALLTAGEMQTLLALPALPPTPLAFAPALDDRQRRERLRPWFGLRGADAEDVIPAGLPEAGRPKYNLNDLAADPDLTPEQRAENIAAVIDRNLPDFKRRDPSLAGETADGQRRYLRRLAASVVDYIDPDTVCTTVSGEPAGRGLLPLVVGVAEQYLWTGGNDSAVIRTRVFVQVWNPYTVNVSGTARFRLANRQRVSFGSGIVTPLADYDAAADGEITVRPNEFKVIEFPAASQTFTSPTPAATGPRWSGSPADAADQTTHQPFEFFWNGARADMSRRPPVGPGAATAGLVRNAKTLARDQFHYQVNAIPTYANRNTVGDPRATFLSNYDWPVTSSADGTYANSTFWHGRSPRDGVFPHTQDFVTTWAARDYVRANPPVGNPPGALNVSPAQTASPYAADRDAPNAPLFTRKGRMLSVGELGNIFDPAQAADDGRAPAGGTPSSVFVSGGGRTLRVGQPEFAYWDRDGMRAIELLDIFTVNDAPADAEYPRLAGRVNVNTAPREVLTALLHGIDINADAGALTVSGSACRLDAARLADVIVSERHTAPFKKLSDLRRVLPALNRADAYQPPLGAGAAAEPPLVMDRAREEAFAKFCNLVTAQSRNYRVYAIGQALAADGAVAAISLLEAIVSVRPVTDGDGRAVWQPEIIYVYCQ
ncbi:MAG: hypothetical protein LBK71_06625 [Verrucomicrobiales bacterium]|jgi:hypothetical protein|nr:hypothetical protein [Verrucomicrobiales bacterium]